MSLINGILYLLSGLGLLGEYFGLFHFGLTAVLTPAFVGLLSTVGVTIYNKRNKDG